MVSSWMVGELEGPSDGGDAGGEGIGAAAVDGGAGDAFPACRSSRWFNVSICLLTAVSFFSTSRIRSLTIS